MNLLATGCAGDILRALNIEAYVPPTVAAEAIYLESDEVGGPREQIDLAELEQRGVLSRTALSDQELDLVVDLARTVDDGEAQVIAIALTRKIVVATDDRKARQVAVQRGASLTATAELLHRWYETAAVGDMRVSEILRRVTRRSRYRPRPDDSLFAWWMNLIADR
jgi:predicted nucleic acid-binding protein